MAAKGRQLVKINVRHPMDVDTMKNMLIQAMYMIFLGGLSRSMLLSVSTMSTFEVRVALNFEDHCEGKWEEGYLRECDGAFCESR